MKLAFSRFSHDTSHLALYTLLAACALTFAACNSLPNVGNLPIPIIGAGTPTPDRQISYDGAVTLSIKAGETLPGTTVAYQGKAADGRAILSINGLQALKATADSVRWSGALVLFSLIDLNLRVVAYDNNRITLAGTIRIIVQDPNPVPAQPAPNPMAAFTVPLTYTVPRGTNIPGTTVSYVGETPDGAQFANLDQFPYRDRLDSVVWQGRLRERITVRYDLRVLDFNADRAILGGTANVMFEP